MRKWLLTALTIISCSTVFANFPEKIETLSTKIILENTNGYFVLSDGSCWKAIGFSKRWRSLSEWWNNVQLVPENYECVPNDWFVGTEIEAYSKYGNLEVSEADASNQEHLKQCTHLLVNRRTGQVLFATALPTSLCIAEVFNEAKAEGYNKGYNAGRAKGYENANEIYNNGYSEGYKKGYTDGVQDTVIEGS